MTLIHVTYTECLRKRRKQGGTAISSSLYGRGFFSLLGRFYRHKLNGKEEYHEGKAAKN